MVEVGVGEFGDGNREFSAAAELSNDPRSLKLVGPSGIFVGVADQADTFRTPPWHPLRAGFVVHGVFIRYTVERIND